MAAGLGFKTFTTGEVLTAADTNGYLMQGVLVFASSAARASAITSPQEGQMSYLKDTNSTEYYSGSAWVAIGGGAGTNTFTTYIYTATSGQTTFSGVDDNGLTLAYTVGSVLVYLNGSLLTPTSDYAASTGTSVVLVSGAITGDTLAIQAVATFTVSTDIAKSTLSAKGNVLTATAASTPAVLAVGTDAQYLVADSTTATGLKWATPASAGGMTSLASGSLSGTSVSITSISGSYNNLQLNLADFYNNAGDFYLQIQFNTDTGSNYIATGVNNANNPWTQSAGAELNLNYNSTKGTSDNNNVASLQIFNYANTTSNKAGIATMSGRNAGNTAMTVTGQFFFYQPATPAAITSIQIKLSTGSFSGGTYELFGVK